MYSGTSIKTNKTKKQFTPPKCVTVSVSCLLIQAKENADSANRGAASRNMRASSDVGSSVHKITRGVVNFFSSRTGSEAGVSSLWGEGRGKNF